MQHKALSFLFVLSVCPSLDACVIGVDVDEPPPGYDKIDVRAFGLWPAPTRVRYDGTCLWADGACYPLDIRGTACAYEETPMDVVFVADEVAAVLCYPVGNPMYSVDLRGGDIEVPSFDDGASVEFRRSTDGAPLSGDIVVRADDVIVFGRGPGTTLIDGDLYVLGERVLVRGLTVMGNAYLDGDDGALAYCDVWGDLFIDGHGVTAAGNLVFSDLSAVGSYPLLVDNGIQGFFDAPASATRQGNYAFFDEDDDGVVRDAEIIAGYD